MVPTPASHPDATQMLGSHRALKLGMQRWLLPPLTLLLCSVLALFWSAAAPVPALAATTVTRTVILLAQEDATVVAAVPTDNFSSGKLHAGTDEIGLIAFDLSALPTGVTIDRGILRVQRTDSLTTSSVVEAVKIDSAWSESDVTWDTRPGMTATGVSTITVGGDIVDLEITTLVQSWYVGSQPNHGVGLAGDSNAVRIASRDTRPAPRLIVTITYADETATPDGADAPFPDLGDAPDSSNHPGVIPNTAYVGVPGRFPTVYDTPAGQPAGPKHANVTVEGYLGDNMSRENEADGGPDQDGVNNILDGGANISNQDRGDDGWQNPHVLLLDCRQSTLLVRVHRAPGAALPRMFLNVWFDGNRDGDWQDAGQCQFDSGQQALSYEHIVQNVSIDMTAIPPGGHVDIPITTLLVHNTAPRDVHWMRFTLSEIEAPLNPDNQRADGRGPHPASPGPTKLYAHGETEDLRYRPLPPIQQTGTLSMTKRIINVSDSGLLTYEIRLRNEGGDGPVDVQLRDRLAYPGHVHGDVDVTDVSPGVSPLTARVDLERGTGGPRSIYYVVKWDGTLAPGAEVILQFDVHTVLLCGPDQISGELTNVAQARIAGQDPIEAEASVELPCLAAARDVEVTQSENYAEESETPVEEDGVGAGNPLHIPLRATLTNTKNVSLTLALQWQALVSSTNISGTRNSAPECRIVNLDPGEQISFDRLFDVAQIVGDWNGDGIDELGLHDLQLQSLLRYQLVPWDADFCEVDDANNPWVAVDEFAINLQPQDVGDAPDSTNHAGAAMTAYTGVQADFPTVFDPATGLPPGPAHLHPRPFHLGALVELERDADLLPAPRNINPIANVANRDRFDDGATPNSWSLKQCETSLINVQVFISPAAAAWFADNGGVGYLNGWLDGNRDGDWADEFTCDPAPPLPPMALEHFMRDLTVDVAALGPGLHTLTVNTGRVPWPASEIQKPAWVRLTLSERPASKPLVSQIVDGLAFGDGRGYTDPFETGETEDYLLYPSSASGGQPDLDLDVRFRWRQAPQEDAGTAALQAAAPQIMDEIDMYLQIDYRNQGGAPAENASLALDLSQLPAFNNASRVEIIQDGRRYTPEELKKISLGALMPGSSGRIIAILIAIADQNPTAQSVDERDVRGSITVQITSDNEDGNPADNRIEHAINLRLPPRILGFKAGNSQVLSTGGVTCADEVTLYGMGIPNSTVRIYDAFRPEIDDEVVVGADGEWQLTLSNLADGDYALLAEEVQTSAVSTMADHLDSPFLVRFGVDSSLPVDASSFAFGDGSVRFPFASNHLGSWHNGDGSDVFNVIAGRSYELAVNACRAPASVEVQLVSKDPSYDNVVQLTDPDGDLRYTTIISIPEKSSNQSGQVFASLNNNLGGLTVTAIDNDGTQSAYNTPFAIGGPGTVVDAITGQPIENAQVTLLGVWTDMRPLSYQEIEWTFKSTGPYTLPLTTDANGEYHVFVPGRVYVLLVEADGYQPFRSPIIAANGAIALKFGLTPTPDNAPDQIVLLGDGGFETLSYRGCLTCTTSLVMASEVAVPAISQLYYRCLTCTVAILNGGLHDRRLTLEIPGLLQAAGESAANATILQSGRLGPGETFVIAPHPTDSFILTDSDNPSVRVQINVAEEPIADPLRVYLPNIRH